MMVAKLCFINTRLKSFVTISISTRLMWAILCHGRPFLQAALSCDLPVSQNFGFENGTHGAGKKSPAEAGLQFSIRT
jgi:hypothetical protein